MLIRFNKFEAINSLDNLDDEKTYTVSVSGKLRDNETHFRGETQITLIPPVFRVNRINHPVPLQSKTCLSITGGIKWNKIFADFSLFE
jgi:hypothetical protein